MFYYKMLIPLLHNAQSIFYYKMLIPLLHNAQTILLQNADTLITFCVSYYKMRHITKCRSTHVQKRFAPCFESTVCQCDGPDMDFEDRGCTAEGPALGRACTPYYRGLQNPYQGRKGFIIYLMVHHNMFKIIILRIFSEKFVL